MKTRSKLEYAVALLLLGSLLAYRSFLDTSTNVVDNLIAAAGWILLFGLLHDLFVLGRRRAELRLLLVPLAKAKGRTVRVSIASLVRLTTEDNVLLVWNRQGLPSAFGGVLKYHRAAESRIRSEFDARASTFANAEDPSDLEKFERDLRLTMPLSKFSSFRKWYSSGTNREHGPLREFWEELQEAGLPVPGGRALLEPSFCRYQTVQSFLWSAENSWYDYLLWEVWEANVPSQLLESIKQQAEAHRKSERKSPGTLVFASPAELKERRLSSPPYQGVELAATAWALDRSIPPPKGWWRSA